MFINYIITGNIYNRNIMEVIIYGYFFSEFLKAMGIFALIIILMYFIAKWILT